MKRSSSMTARSALLALPIAAALAAGGCNSGSDSDEPEPAPKAPEGNVIAEYVLKIRPREANPFVLQRVVRAPKGANGGPGISPQSWDTATLSQDDTPGTGPADTVELVTNSTGTNGSCPAPYQTNTFCGNVTLRSFYTRSLSHVYVEVTSITDATTGASLTDHSGVNSDTAPSGLSSALGLWRHTGQGVTTAGVLGKTSPYNAGARDWVFANPDGADTNIYLRVVTALTYASYTRSLSFRSFVDACTVSGATNLGKTNGVATATLPFTFTLYGFSSTALSFTKKAQVLLGSSFSFSSNGNNVQLPSNSAAKPGMFPFWDDLTYGTGASSALCYVTQNSEPNRLFRITWKQMDFTSNGSKTDKIANMNFTLTLREGSNEIDMNYSTMSGPSTRAQGGYTDGTQGATVGVQDQTGTVATATFNLNQYPSGTAHTYFPQP